MLPCMTVDRDFVYVTVVFDSSSMTTSVAWRFISVKELDGMVKRIYHPMVLGTTVCGPPTTSENSWIPLVPLIEYHLF